MTKMIILWKEWGHESIPNVDGIHIIYDSKMNLSGNEKLFIETLFAQDVQLL